MSAEAEVREASGKHYAAMVRMLNGDATSLVDVWSHDAAATAMHPIGGRQVGWEQVRGSFEGVAGIATNGRLELRDPFVHVVGDVAYELGLEHGAVAFAGQQVSIEHRVTNIYRREGGAWKVIHHHTDTSPSMQEVVARAQEGA